MTELIHQYLIQNGALEWLGVFTGILCVWLAAKNNIWNWPFAIISVAIYIFIFFETRLYADMGLQFYFMVMNIYGWYYWSRKKNKAAQKSITLMHKGEWIFAILSVTAFTILLGFTLHRNTDASFPFIDSFCTACSLIGQFFLARRVLQNWLIWIFVDLIYVGVYCAKGLYPTAGMYALYIFIAYMGYKDWKMIYSEQKN